MSKQSSTSSSMISTLEELAKFADYSYTDTLVCDPQARLDGLEHDPRQVFSGHFVPVKPTAINAPVYIAHSYDLFQELGLSDDIAQQEDFVKMFSGDVSTIPLPMKRVGWATGYALSIFGTEYYQQCPFQTGNGYGDGRAVSILEALLNGKRWEMQLKGGGRTPYCRGGDGRAVLRSSVREFIAQEHMHALGIPTSRSLSLYVSKTDEVKRPWYSEGSQSFNPDRMVFDPVAISTRVAPSFIRVGQLELFGRRARRQEHPNALKELVMLVLHLIDREYSDDIANELSLTDKVLKLASLFRDRLTSLVANWIRVGYCQGNFNSDNCAAGGFTLDYGPFGFCEAYDPQFQPWTGGGHHFSFLHQPVAAERNFEMMLLALVPLVASDQEALQQLEALRLGFPNVMQDKLEKMWAAKLGLETFDAVLFTELEALMVSTPVDFTLFFRELSNLPDDIAPLKKSFYNFSDQNVDNDLVELRWSNWHAKWKSLIADREDAVDLEQLSVQMKLINPKYIMREWLVVPAYQQAGLGNYEWVRELQRIMTHPYDELSSEIEHKYYRLKPLQFSAMGGVSHYSCSS